MKINGTHYRTIWIDEQDCLRVIDQRLLPHTFATPHLPDHAAVCEAIRNMTVRGAGLIGAAAGYGMWLAAMEAPDEAKAFDAHMRRAAATLLATRPTAANLAMAVNRQLSAMDKAPTVAEKKAVTRTMAERLADEDADFCRRIGEHGLTLIRKLHDAKPGKTIQILTHCNAGWLAFVDYGSALAPVYAAHDAGIPVHVWVDETRPRNQGAALTAFELAGHGVPHSLIADNTGGHLMSQGMVDMVITGADRVTRNGDVANKIGTYLKALAAHDNGLPFVVALPSSTLDFAMAEGSAIPIEERHPDEVRLVNGLLADGSTAEVRICPEATPARNWAFDVTPARLVSGLITERGVCAASESALLDMFPEHAGTRTEGVILFQAEHSTEPLESPELAAILHRLDVCRTRLHEAGLIGVLQNGVGYGNLSCRLSDGAFLISGSGTGGARHLGPDGYTVVEACNPDENSVRSRGPVPPSSESMTHRAVYDGQPGAYCVVHAHHPELFRSLAAVGAPGTPVEVTYGTPAMAHAVAALTRTMTVPGLFITHGHPDGIFAFGTTPESVTQLLLDQLNSPTV